MKSALIIQAARFSSHGEFDRAVEWTVQPGATDVEVKEIVGMPKADENFVVINECDW